MITRVTDGASRTVFLVGRWAIKVPCGRYGWEQWLKGILANLQERRLSVYQHLALCPVLFADPLGLVIVMPRAEILAERLSMADYQAHFSRWITRFGPWVPAENKADSFGYLEGRLVAVDYGN